MSPALSLKARALRLLAAREYSRAELERRLAPHAGDAEALTGLLDELTQLGYLSEQRAAEAHAHRRASRLGIARIEQELRDRGVDAAVIADAVQALRPTELARARAVWRRKFHRPPDGMAEFARQVRFLAQRGFSMEVIRQTISCSGMDVDESPG